MSFSRIFVKQIIIIAFLITLSGCSVWDNFTTYFNLYFNASSLFEDAETEIFNQKRDLFSNDPLVVPGNAKTLLNKVVEKCSKLLQFYSNSSYVDEALMMLGKSFYYQSNFQKAKRKFEELLITNPDDEITAEATLWIAKCAFELKDYPSALSTIEQVRIKAVEEGFDDIIKESYVQEIKYRIKEQQYPLAIKLSQEFADEYDNDVVRAQIYYELGNLYKLTKDNQNALLSYEKVFDYAPDFDLEINATIKYGNALRNDGLTDKALEVFENIRNKDKFISSFSEIDFEIGKTYVQLEQYNKAYNQFRLVDTTYRNTLFASASNFEIGNLYRYHLFNYDSAAYYYSKAPLTTLPDEYKESAKSAQQLFVKYQKLRKEISRYDRQLFYSENPDIFARDSAAYVADSLKLLTEYLEKKEMQEIWRGVDTMFQANNRNLKDSLFIKDSIFVKDSLAKIDSLINLGLFNPTDTVGLKKSLLDSLNVKRNAKLKDPKDPRNILNQLQSGIKLDSVKFKKNPPLKLKISIDSAQTILAKSSLELGNLFLAEINVPDSAYKLYNRILEKYPSPSYYPNTLYALGSYYLTRNEKSKADSLFEFIYSNYKNRAIVNAAANKLNKPLIDLNFDPAKEIYTNAEDLMIDSVFDQSLTKLFSIYRNFPKSAYAPQSLYAAGWILENNLLLPDSAAAVYDTLLNKYPTSVYGKKIAGKMAAYKQEKAKLQKSLKDSLSLNQNLSNDLIASGNQNKNDINVNKEDNSPDEESNQLVQNDISEKNKQVLGSGKKKLDPLWDPRKHFN